MRETDEDDERGREAVDEGGFVVVGGFQIIQFGFKERERDVEEKGKYGNNNFVYLNS